MFYTTKIAFKAMLIIQSYYPTLCLNEHIKIKCQRRIGKTQHIYQVTLKLIIDTYAHLKKRHYRVYRIVMAHLFCNSFKPFKTLFCKQSYKVILTRVALF